MSSPVSSSTVLGKRPHIPDPSTPTHTDAKRQLQTPDNTPNPKRPRVSNIATDGDGNKENVPPFNVDPIASPSSPRATRSLRRTTSDGSPSRARYALPRRASTSAMVPATPTVGIAQLTLATPPPTPPNSLQPIHARARALLRATCNSSATEMAGRDAEREAISAFFASLNHSADAVEHTSLYISGSPGTGKTALVNSIIRSLSIDQVQVIMINCMALNSVDVLWERLIEELGGVAEKKRKNTGRGKKIQGRDAVEALLSVATTKCIIILDELDHVAPTAQSLSSLFSLSASRPLTLRVVGIANTHTLTASSSVGFVPSAANVRTIHFAPYTPAQLLQILQSRLAPLYIDESDDAEAKERASQEAKRFLSAPALNLLTKKVAALTGDVRSLFEVLRGAIDLAIASTPSTPSPTPARTEENPLNPTIKNAVGPSHILAALKAYTPASIAPPRVAGRTPPAAANSEIVTKIRTLGLHARLALLALLLASKRLEAGLSLSTTSSSASPMKRTASSSSFSSAFGVVDPTQLHTFYSAVLSRSGDGIFPPVSRSEFNDLVGMLEGVGLVVCAASAAPSGGSTSHGKGKQRAFGRSASFGYGTKRGGSASDVQLAPAVRTDEVLRGLGISEGAANDDVAVEEVNAIWVKENGRLARDVSARDNKAKKDKVVAGFDDAMED